MYTIRMKNLTCEKQNMITVIIQIQLYKKLMRNIVFTSCVSIQKVNQKAKNMKLRNKFIGIVVLAMFFLPDMQAYSLGVETEHNNAHCYDAELSNPGNNTDHRIYTFQNKEGLKFSLLCTPLDSDQSIQKYCKEISFLDSHNDSVPFLLTFKNEKSDVENLNAINISSVEFYNCSTNEKFVTDAVPLHEIDGGLSFQIEQSVDRAFGLGNNKDPEIFGAPTLPPSPDSDDEPDQEPEIPDAVDLISPANNSDDVHSDTTLTWQSGDLADRYTVHISEFETFETLLLDSTATDTTYVIDGLLESGSTYYWRVKALNEDGESDWSTVWNFTTSQDASLPERVVLLTPENNSVGISPDTTLIWQESGQADNYNLQLSMEDTFQNLIIDSTLTQTTFDIIEKLDFNTSYYWRVKAENAAGESNWSTVWNFTTEKTIPNVVILQEPADEATDVTLTPRFIWDESENAESYQLQLSLSIDFDANTIVADSSGIETTELILTNDLDENTTYYWRVRASNTAGSSEWSVPFTFETLMLAPEVAELVSPDSGAIDLEIPITFDWMEADRASAYIIQISDSEGFETTVLSEETEFTEFTLDQENILSPSETYYWRVQSVRGDLSSDWSDVWTFETAASTSISDLVDLPEVLTLNQNYPNPFNPTTQIQYGLPANSEVRLEVFNMLGQRVATLVNGRQSAGWHEVRFEASNLSSGIYIYRLTAGEFIQTRQMMLVK